MNKKKEEADLWMTMPPMPTVDTGFTSVSWSPLRSSETGTVYLLEHSSSTFHLLKYIKINRWCLCWSDIDQALTLSLDQGTMNVGTRLLSIFLPMTKNLCLRCCCLIHEEQQVSSCWIFSRGFRSFRSSVEVPRQVLYTVLTLRPCRARFLTDLNFIFTTIDHRGEKKDVS